MNMRQYLTQYFHSLDEDQISVDLWPTQVYRKPTVGMTMTMEFQSTITLLNPQISDYVGWPLGRLQNWSHALDVGYAGAVKAGRVDEWVHEVCAHADHGRRHLLMMENIGGILPKEMWKIRELWRQKVELLKVLLRGIDCIELRVNIVEPGQFNLLK